MLPLVEMLRRSIWASCLSPKEIVRVAQEASERRVAAGGLIVRMGEPADHWIGIIEGLVKITDFGISHASGDVTLTQTGQITGTPAFLAPEVAQGREMTEASDVFSLGATLYT